MKILQINTSLEGSIGSIMLDLHYAITNKYDDNSSFIFVGKSKFNQNFNNINIKKVNYKLFTYLNRIIFLITGNESNFISNISSYFILKKISNLKPDLIHIHNLHGFYLNPILFLKHLYRKNYKLIFTLHDEYIYTGKCCYTFNCNNWKTFCNNCPSLNDYPRSYFDNTYINFIEKIKSLKQFKDIHFVFPSLWLLNRFEQSLLQNNFNRNLIYNGIDLTKFKKHSKFSNILYNDKFLDKKIIVSIANSFFDGRKGGEYIQIIADKLKSNKNIVFILISKDVSIFNIQENIVTFNYNSDKNFLSYILSISDIFLYTSKSDNLPTVCIESLACGTPIVGFNSGGISEIVEYNTGILVPYGHLDSLYEAIFKMINKKSDVTSLCIQSVLSKFDKKIMTENYLKLYKSYLNV